MANFNSGGLFNRLFRIDTVVSLVTTAGSAVGFISSYISDWSPAAILLATLGAGAFVAVFYNAIRTLPVTITDSKPAETADLIPIVDAARRAYSETEGSTFATMAERGLFTSDKSTSQSDRVLIAYANNLEKHATIWGCKKPAITPRPQNLSGFVIDWIADDHLIAREQFGPAIIDNLMVGESDLTKFIDRIRRFPDEKL